jgi:hypothetical protein
MNRTTIVGILMLVVSLCGAEGALAIEGLRGSTWGEVRQEIPDHGENNLIVDTWIRQGIDWVKWGDSASLNTYATVRLKWDSEKLDWNNSVGPGVGIAIDYFTHKGLNISWGMEYLWDRFYESGRSEQKLVLYMNWYGWWDLKKNVPTK